MAYAGPDTEPKDDVLREATLALMCAVEAQEPDPEALAAAIARVRRTLDQNAYQMVNNIESVSGSSGTEPFRQKAEVIDPIIPPVGPEAAATWPRMAINHAKVASSRLFRGKTNGQIILVTLLWNQDREVDKDDLLDSFATQAVPIKPETLLSRISKMRTDGLIAHRQRMEEGSKYVDSPGVYRLTEKGVAAARIAATKLNALPSGSAGD